MLTIDKVVIDTMKTLGETLLLTEVTPWYEYVNGKRKEEPIGYRYVVAIQKHGLEKLPVKIKGKQLVEATDDCPRVKFNGIEMHVYVIDGNPLITATATGIALVDKATA